MGDTGSAFRLPFLWIVDGGKTSDRDESVSRSTTWTPCDVSPLKECARAYKVHSKEAGEKGNDTASTRPTPVFMARICPHTQHRIDADPLSGGRLPFLAPVQAGEDVFELPGLCGRPFDLRDPGCPRPLGCPPWYGGAGAKRP
jgi:hypothetical protein